MPYIVAFKEPSVTIVLEGQLNMDQKKQFLQAFKQFGETIVGKAIDGQEIIIPLNRNVNIAYIKAITQQQYENMKTKHENASKILRPSMVIPSNKIKRN